MGKKKGKEKEKNKKQSKQAVEQQAKQPGKKADGKQAKQAKQAKQPKQPKQQPVEPEEDQESLASAVMAAKESAKALQEAASAFSQQMNAANDMLATPQTPGYGAAGLGLGAGSRYDEFGGSSAYGRATNYRSLGASRRANKAQSGYPFGGAAGYMPGASGYGMGNQMPSPYDHGASYPYGQQHYQQNQAQGSAYAGYGSPYTYNNGYETGSGYDPMQPQQPQDHASAAAQQVAAAQNAAFNAASKANSTAGAAGAAGATAGMSEAAANIYNSYNQNPAYAVNEDLLTNLPKFGEAPYPLPEPQEILESVPSLTSLAFGTTAAQMHDQYGTASNALQANEYAPLQSGDSEDDGVIFAYVEDAGPIDLTDTSESGKKKKKKQAAEAAAAQQAAYAGAAGAYGYGYGATGSSMEEISIPAVYGDEDGFSVEIPMEAEGEPAYSQEISAEYYEVDDSNVAGYYQGQGEYAYEGYTHEADVYESYDGYYYDEAGNVYYYDENGNPYYYDEYGNAYYYDNYGYGNQMMPGAPPKSTGMVLGILSIVFAFFPIVGLILGFVAAGKAKKHINSGGTSPNAYTARIFGRLGIILSIVVLLLYIGLIVAFFLSLYPADTMHAIREFLAGTPFSFVL